MTVLTISICWLTSACTASVTATTPPILTPTTVPVTPTSPPTLTLQATATQVPFFQVYGDKPIVPNGADGAWDDRFTDPGAVVYYNGLFHMFRNGFRDFPAESYVGHVTSQDGYTWTKEPDEPILKTKDVPYAKIAMYASSVIVEDNGQWVIYVYTWDSASNPSSSVIGRIMSAIPTGPWIAGAEPQKYPSVPWTAEAEPVLKPGKDGDWDDRQVLAPHVLKTETGYIMYYSGVGSSGIQQIGMATSRDGIQWTKYDDAATTEKPYAESDPVFQPGDPGDWDSGWVHQPRVFQTLDGWVMFYRGTADKNGLIMKLGVATGKDGIHWDRSPLNPLLKPSDVSGAQYFWFTNLVYHDDSYFLFWEVDKRQSTEIYLATHKDGIP